MITHCVKKKKKKKKKTKVAVTAHSEYCDSGPNVNLSKIQDLAFISISNSAVYKQYYFQTVTLLTSTLTVAENGSYCGKDLDCIKITQAAARKSVHNA